MTMNDQHLRRCKFQSAQLIIFQCGDEEQGLQEMRHKQGYYESEIRPDDPFGNEMYVYR